VIWEITTDVSKGTARDDGSRFSETSVLIYQTVHPITKDGIQVTTVRNQVSRFLPNSIRFVRPYIQEKIIVRSNKHVIPNRTLCNLCSKYSIAKQLRTVTTGPLQCSVPAIELNHFLCSCFLRVVSCRVFAGDWTGFKSAVRFISMLLKERLFLTA
jgi:hypothetical protein